MSRALIATVIGRIWFASNAELSDAETRPLPARRGSVVQAVE